MVKACILGVIKIKPRSFKSIKFNLEILKGNKLNSRVKTVIKFKYTLAIKRGKK